MPRTSAGATPAAATASRTAAQTARPDLGARLLDDRARLAEERDVALRGAEHPAVGVEDAGARAAGADVDADEAAAHGVSLRGRR